MAVMLNLGAGLQAAPGWTNYDRSRAVLVSRSARLRAAIRIAHRAGLASKGDLLEWPKTTRCVDVTKGIPHADATVDVVYTSHLLEHLRPSDLDFVLRECHRVLKPSGVLRVVVPDLRMGATKFIDGDRRFFALDPNEPIADGFVSWMSLRSGRKGGTLERLIRRVMRTDENGHEWMYDGESMSYRISRAGFRDPMVRPYRVGGSTAAAELDWREFDSVHIEAIK